MGLVILGLAVWRVSSLLVNEEGPWELFARLRHRLGVRYDVRSKPIGTTMVSKALTCVWCTSVWVGTGGGVFYLLAPRLTMALCLPLALSAVAILVNKAVEYE